MDKFANLLADTFPFVGVALYSPSPVCPNCYSREPTIRSASPSGQGVTSRDGAPRCDSISTGRTPSRKPAFILLAACLWCLPLQILAQAPPNDRFTNRITLTGLVISTNATNVNATKDTGEPNHAGYAGGRSVWWSWTAPTNGVVVLNITNSSPALTDNALLAVYTGSTVSGLTSVASNAFAGLLTFSAVAGTAYRIAVDGYGGATGTFTLSLTRFALPANDFFTNRFTLSGAAASTSAYNYGATRETGEPNHAGYTGGKSVWWTWTAPTNGQVTVTITNSSFYALLGVYRGSSVASLTNIASGQGNNGSATFKVVGGAAYQIAVDGYSGVTGTFALSLNFSPVQPNDFFTNRLTLTGTAISTSAYTFGATKETGEPYHAGYSGGQSVWWTWTAPTNGLVILNITNSSNSTLVGVYTGSTVSGLNPVANNYGYDNVVSFSAIAGTSYQIAVDCSYSLGASFTLSLNFLAAPANDLFADRFTLSGTAVATSGSNNSAGSEPGEPNHAGYFGGHSVWWTWTAPTDGVVVLNTTNNSFQTALAVYTGSNVSALSLVAANAYYSGYSSLLTFNAVAGNVYQIAVATTYGLGGPFDLNLNYRPGNDIFTNRYALSGSRTTVTGSNFLATKEPSEPNHAGNFGGKSVWWTWMALTNALVTVDTIGSSFDTLLAIYTGTNVSGLALVASDDENGATNTSLVAFSVVAGATYQIAVDGRNGASGNIALHIAYTGLSTIQLGATAYSANERDEGVTLTVTRTGSSLGPVAVNCLIPDGSAISGQDHYAATTNHLVWFNGESGTKTVFIPLINDALVESNETFSVLLTDPAGNVTLVNPGFATVTILDDDSPAVVQWSSASYVVNENGTAWLELRRSGGVTNASVNFATSNATAVAGSDFVAANGTITFAPNEATKLVAVNILDDYTIEGDESFTVRLFNPVGAGIGAIANITVTIRDSGYSPEDLYGHSLQISNNQSLYADFYAARFTNRLTLFNPSFGTSRSGYVELTNLYTFSADTNRFSFPIIPGRGTVQIVVYGDGSGQYLQDGIRRYVYATIYENAGDTNQPPQAEFSTGIFYTLGTSPPDGGEPGGSGSGAGAGGLTLPPALTNVVVTGPAVVEENSSADYVGTASFANGTTYTNMTAAWSSSAFSISAAGRLAAGGVLSDAPLTIAGAITYGSATKTGTVPVTVVKVRSPQLHALGLTNNEFQFQLSGTTGRRYALEARTDLSAANNWFVVTTSQILSNSVQQLADPAATNAVRIYRAREF